MGETDRPQMTIHSMCFACWISKTTNTRSEYVILIFFPQQWLHKRASMLRYTYIESLVNRYYKTTVSNVLQSATLNASPRV
jgi:hypothetical protein